MNCFFRAHLCAIAFCALAPFATAQNFTTHEINPTHPEAPAGFFNSGGRVNRVARATDSIYYAASEFGGLFKSIDGGNTWARLDRHLPTEMFGVRVSPADPERVIATSLFDGRVNTIAGINVSTDGGLTWFKPPSSHLPLNCESSGVSQPSAFEIAFNEENPSNVFVGTSCGLAKSTDGGLTWSFVNPGPAAQGTNVYGVTVHHGGIIDTCGSGGHRRSIDGGVTWTGASAGGRPLISGRCSIVASPDEPSVLFATVGTKIFESDDGGGTWDTEFVNPRPQGRIPFVNINNRKGRDFDLWFGDVLLHRASCRTPPAGLSGPRCPPSNTWTDVLGKGHVDLGYVVFTNPEPHDPGPCQAECDGAKGLCHDDCAAQRADCLSDVGRVGRFTPAQCQRAFIACIKGCKQQHTACVRDCGVAAEPCPAIMGSDGGVYYNRRIQMPNCHTPDWARPQVTTRALWLWTLNGLNVPNSLSQEHLYFGTQDNGGFVSLNAGAATPSWRNPDRGDIFDMVPDNTRVLYTQWWPGGSHVIIRHPGLAEIPPPKDINKYPPGVLAFGNFEDVLARFGHNRYVIATSAAGFPSTSEVFVTLDISQNPILWTKLGQTLGFVCGLSVSGPSENPTFYAKVCTFEGSMSLYRYVGTSSTGTWQRILLAPDTFSSNNIGVFAVDPNNPNRLVVSQRMFIGAPVPPIRMIRSDDGGATWTTMPALDALMTGNGTYLIHHSINIFQPRLLAFDPHDSNTIVAGAVNAGVFLTRNNGATWETITNNSGDPGNPVIPWPHTAYFNRECGSKKIFIGTKGRGAWRISYPDPNGPSKTSCQTRCDAPAADCEEQCIQTHKLCLKGDLEGHTTASQCNVFLINCKADCSNERNACRQACVDCPK